MSAIPDLQTLRAVMEFEPDAWKEILVEQYPGLQFTFSRVAMDGGEEKEWPGR